VRIVQVLEVDHFERTHKVLELMRRQLVFCTYYN
jgi:hypothetical protein